MSQIQLPSQYRTVNELATASQLAVATVTQHLQNGRIKGVKFGKVWRISEEEFQRVMKEGISLETSDTATDPLEKEVAA